MMSFGWNMRMKYGVWAEYIWEILPWTWQHTWRSCHSSRHPGWRSRRNRQPREWLSSWTLPEDKCNLGIINYMKLSSCIYMESFKQRRSSLRIKGPSVYNIEWNGLSWISWRKLPTYTFPRRQEATKTEKQNQPEAKRDKMTNVKKWNRKNVFSLLWKGRRKKMFLFRKKSYFKDALP